MRAIALNGKCIYAFVVVMTFTSTSHTQSFPNNQQSINNILATSKINLRNAIIEHRNISQSLCKMNKGTECDAVVVMNAQISVLDIEIKYSKLSYGNFPNEVREKFKRIVDAASNANQSLSDLNDELN